VKRAETGDHLIVCSRKGMPGALLLQLQHHCAAHCRSCSAMPAVLQPLRGLRPSSGGKGWDPVIGMQLRGLNFDLSVGDVEE
jgi:hypothetical protein